MKLQQITFTVEQLRGIPDGERSLVVLLCHALNEVNAFNKILFLCTKIEPEPRWIAHCHAAQAMMLARALVGKLNEAWNIVQRGYFGTKLSMIYADSLELSATEALCFLKAYFGRKNLINEVRNDFAFHYSLEHAKTSVPEDSSPEDLAAYLHEHHGNSMYYFAEYLMSKALIGAVSPTDPEAALGKVLDEMAAVIKNLNEFVQGLLFVVLDKYIGAEVVGQSVQTVDLGMPAQSADIRIPFFFEVSRPNSGEAA